MADRFLLVRLGSLGDIIHAIPAAAALRARHPDARIDWAVDPRYVELLQLVSVLNSCIPLDPRGNRSRLLGTIRTLRRTAYDAAVDLQGLIKSAVLTRAAGARRTIGMPRAHLREPFAGAFYTETPDPGGMVHVVHKNLAIMRALDVTDTRVAFPLNIPRSATADALAGRFDKHRYALLNPGAAWPNKRWPPVRFGAVAAAIRERLGLRSVVLWGPGEESIGAEVVQSSSGAAELSPATAIADLFAIAKGAAVIVSGDTGPLHIGAAVGTPVVALFGPTWPERNGPWDTSDITLSRAESCSCHYERRCRRSNRCIDDISVDEVIAAAERRLRGR